MATREFNSDYIHGLAELALEGLDNHINNKWIDECIWNHEYIYEQMKTRWNRFLRLFGMGRKEPLPLEEYIEYRKTVLYSIYSDTYTLWKSHTDDYVDVKNKIIRICNLAEENEYASKLTRLDDKEYNTLNKYAAVVAK